MPYVEIKRLQIFQGADLVVISSIKIDESLKYSIVIGRMLDSVKYGL